MRIKWTNCLFIFCFLLSNSITAQIDTEFWFAAPEIAASEGDSPIYLRFLSYDNPADITVSLPANGGFTAMTLSLGANQVGNIDLTAFLTSIESPAADVTSNNGIKIVSTEKISAFYELQSGSNKEVFSLKGTKALGDNFYTPFQKFWDNSATTPVSFSSIDIIATEDNTTVLITPRTAVVGHVQDVTYSVVLNEGETYSARDINTTALSSLAGSIVSSNKPVAITIFSGALSNSGCSSAMGDQITSVEFTGRNYIVHKGTSSSDRVYVMATQNGTSLTITNSGTTTSLINWGETFELALTDDINYISASKPVYVWHASGYGCELSGAQVPAVNCAGTYSTGFTRTTTDSLGLMLYTRTGFEGQFALNGNASLIPSSAFNVVPGTSGEYQVAQIHFSIADVPVDSYNEVTNTGDIFGLGVLSGANGSGSSYAYHSEFTSYPIIDAGLNDTICANISLPVTGIVGGGDVTGIWSGTGFGSFAVSEDQLINTYIPSPLDTLISPIQLILTTTGLCPLQKDTLFLVVEPAPIVSASADQSLCLNNSSVQLLGSVVGGAVTGEWSSEGTGTFTPSVTDLNAIYTPSSADLSNGSVKLVLTSTNFGSCLAESDTMEVVFTAAPFVDVVPDTLYACENNSLVDLTGAVSGNTSTGKWTTSGNGIFTPDNLNLLADYQPTQDDINAGQILIHLESTGNGSCNVVYDSVYVIFTAPATVDAGTNFLTCTNDASVILNGAVTGSSTTGLWSGGSGVYSTANTDLISGYTPTAAEILAGNLVLTLTSTNNGGCLAVIDNVQINFIAPPIANFDFTLECLYEPTVFTDFSIPGYGTINNWSWDFGDFQTSINQNETHQYTTAGAYDVEYIVSSDIGCSDTLTQTINTWEIPVAGFSFTSDCPNNQIIVDFTDESTSNTDVIDYFFYDFGSPSIPSSTVEDPTQLFSTNGNYTIQHIVGTDKGCYDTLSQVLTVEPTPIANFTYNTDNSSNVVATVNFINSSTDTSNVSWVFGNSTTSNSVNPSVTYLYNDNYEVVLYVSNALGCTDSAFQIISITNIVPPDEIITLIPNAISPNNDGKNDVWKLSFLSDLYPESEIQIFNGWGQQIFESVGYETPWDGTYHGERVNDGTYYYILNLNHGNGNFETLKGTILVLNSKN